jgi:hypothetical protein
MARKIKVETPGEPASPEAAADPAAPAVPAAAPPDVSALAPPPSPDAVVAAASSPAAENQAKEARLTEQLETTKQLVGAGAALDWSHLTQPSVIELKTKNADADLPNAAEFDPFKIPFGQKILTRQGWLLSTAPDPRARQV